MTIEKFMESKNIKNRKKVEKWIENGYIPNASLKKDYIPDSARIPYTQARARKADAIYLSIIRASELRYHVIPDLYSLTQNEFDFYIEQLVQANILAKRVEDEVTYYDITLSKLKYTKNMIFELIESVSKATTEGLSNAFINQAS